MDYSGAPQAGIGSYPRRVVRPYLGYNGMRGMPSADPALYADPQPAPSAAPYDTRFNTQDQNGDWPTAAAANPAVAAIAHGADVAKAASAPSPGNAPPPVADEDDDDEPRDYSLQPAADSVHPALTNIAQAMQQADSQPSPIDQIIARLSGPPQVSDADRGLAIAKAGFGMAASRSPFLGNAIGEGGLAGISAFQEAQREAAANQARAGSLALTNEARKETARHNQVTEGYRTEDIKEKHLDREARTNEMKLYHDALMNRGKWTLAGYDNEGHPQLYDSNSGKEKVLGIKVDKPAKGGGNDVFSKKLSALKAAGYSEKEATDIASGIKPTDAATAQRVAIAAAKAKSSTETSPAKQREVYDRVYQETLDSFQGGAAPRQPAAAAPATGVPARPAAVPQGAKFSPSQKAWWWKNPAGGWESAPAGP